MMQGSKHVKVKKRQGQDILHFCVDAKTDISVHRDPLDHLSAKFNYGYHNQAHFH